MVAFCRGEAAKRAAGTRPRCAVLDASAWQTGQENADLAATLRQELRTSAPSSELPTVGIPVLIVAMIADEAAAIEANPQQIEDEAGKIAFDQFTTLYQSYVAVLKAAADQHHEPLPASPLTARYHTEREQWKPFASSSYTAADLIADVAQELNRKPTVLEGRMIWPQIYPFDVMLDPTHPMRALYDEILRSGCVVLADEFSLFEPKLRQALASIVALPKSQVALVTISPLNPRLVPPHSEVEKELRRVFEAAFKRFDQYDPQSEVMVADERRLKRWLYLSLPQTLRSLQNPGADPERLEQVWGSAGVDPLAQGVINRQRQASVL